MKRSVLLLDEPTNHLDFETVEALGTALRQFQGTVFFISHDRTFVHLVANEIIEVKDGSVVRYPGSYADYVYHLEHQVRRELTADQDGGSQMPSTAKKPSDYHQRKQQASAQRKLAGQITRSEEQQRSYRQEKEQLEDEMTANATAWTRERAQRHEEVTRLLQEAEHRWVKLTEQLESLGGG